MQGTIAVLMALSGLGCHHKSCDVAPVPSCYSAACYGGGYSGCYALSYAAPVAPVFESYPTMQGPIVMDGCYGGCYSSAGYGPACYASACYSEPIGDACYGGCYGGRKRHGLFACLFGGHGHKRRASYCPPPAPACYASACYGGGYAMGMPVYGDFTPAYVTSGPIYGSGQVISSGQWISAPQDTAPATAPAGSTPAPPAETTPPPPPVQDDAPPPPPAETPAPAETAPAPAP